MLTGVAAVYAMITIGIYLHIKLFAQLHQMLGVFSTVLEVNIIVCHTMYQQQIAVQLVGPCESSVLDVARA